MLGFAAAKDIIASLTRAGTDIVEVGFLRNVDGYNPDVTVCNTIEELNRLLPAHTGSTMYSGMAMRSNYDIAKLSPYEGHGIEMLLGVSTLTVLYGLTMACTLWPFSTKRIISFSSAFSRMDFGVSW